MQNEKNRTDTEAKNRKTARHAQTLGRAVFTFCKPQVAVKLVIGN